MELWPVDLLLEKEYGFLVNEAGFIVLAVDKYSAKLKKGDIEISLRNDIKDGGFAVVVSREGALLRFYPLTDYADFFEGKRTRHVGDIPPAPAQAAKLKDYLPRIVNMLHTAPDSDQWKAYDKFFTRW